MTIKKIDTVGIDLVAMSVNDLICMGATPLFFLDYIACSELIPDQINEIVKGIVKGCKQSKVALLGGETAEMSDLYRAGDFDLAGFCVGVVDKKKLIDGSSIKKGDSIYALPSSGFHSNGYTLIRKVLETKDPYLESLSLDELLRPTSIYVEEVKACLKQYSISGIAHVTGGGMIENIERVIPQSLKANIEFDNITIPSCFKTIQDLGAISNQEMYKVFNMGVGLFIVSPDDITTHDHLVYCGKIIER